MFRQSIKKIAEKPAKLLLTDTLRSANLSHGEQAELARHMKVSRQAVNNWLRGRSFPSISACFRAWDWLRARVRKIQGLPLEQGITIDLEGRKQLLREVYIERWGQEVGGKIPITNEDAFPEGGEE